MKAAILKESSPGHNTGFMASRSPSHELFIRRCLELAEGGRGRVSPNPLVGCVITVSNKVVAEGWHRGFGEPHAEVDAINQVIAKLQITNYKLQTNLPAGRQVPKFQIPNGKELTLYVNLEPCCMQGKMPPCTEAILQTGIRRVVFGARDPSNPGAEILKRAGVEVIGPILEPLCRRFNRGFYSLIEQRRPWVTMKKALQRNGSVPSTHVTNEEQDTFSHRWLRATHDAILVGSGTVIADNPRLTIRFVTKNVERRMNNAPLPRRIILDPHSKVPPTAHVLTDSETGRTMVIREKLPVPLLLERLKGEGIASVLVEGGPGVWKSFEESGCIDEEIILVGG